MANGSYWLKFEVSNGSTIEFTRPLTVLRPDHGLSLGVFNSAGERVAELPLPPDADPDSLALETGSGGEAHLSYHSPAGTGLVVWSGLDRQGLAVANGSYLLRTQGQGSSKSLDFTLLRGPVPGGSLQVAPNPVGAAYASVRLDFWVPPGSGVATARLFALDGALVRESRQPAAPGVMALDISRLSAGIYVVVLDVDGPGSYRQSKKLALVH